MTETVTEPTDSLRERQMSLTRSSILDAVQSLLAGGVIDFTVQDVADRAGVSHRTIYRHFESREALVDGLVDAFEQTIGDVAAPPVHADDIAPMVRDTFAAIETLGPAAITLIALGMPGDKMSENRIRRQDAIFGALQEVTEHLQPGDADAVAWVLRHLASVRTMTRLRREGRIDGAHSGRAVAWALEVLIDALRRGEGPSPEQEE